MNLVRDFVTGAIGGGAGEVAGRIAASATTAVFGGSCGKVAAIGTGAIAKVLAGGTAKAQAEEMFPSTASFSHRRSLRH